VKFVQGKGLFFVVNQEAKSCPYKFARITLHSASFKEDKDGAINICSDYHFGHVSPTVLVYPNRVVRNGLNSRII